jgi:hypothetical protein
MNMVAFEAMNNVRIEVRMSVGDHHGRSDLLIAALAHPRNVEIGEVPPLASVSLSCLGSHLKSLEAALIHALYLLDGQLAENALGEVKIM